MQQSENTRPVLGTWEFNAYEVSVLDVYPPAYILPSKGSDMLSSYGIEGYVEIGAGRSRPLEDRSTLLLFRKHEENKDAEPVRVLHGQKVIFYGYREFGVSPE